MISQIKLYSTPCWTWIQNQGLHIVSKVTVPGRHCIRSAGNRGASDIWVPPYFTYPNYAPQLFSLSATKPNSSSNLSSAHIFIKRISSIFNFYSALTPGISWQHIRFLFLHNIHIPSFLPSVSLQQLWGRLNREGKGTAKVTNELWRREFIYHSGHYNYYFYWRIFL